jgi:hypothetical protein
MKIALRKQHAFSRHRLNSHNRHAMSHHFVLDALRKRMVYQFTKSETGKLETGSACATTRLPHRYTTICRSCQDTRRSTFLPIVRALADPSVVLSSVPFVQSRFKVVHALQHCNRESANVASCQFPGIAVYNACLSYLRIMTQRRLRMQPLLGGFVPWTKQLTIHMC